MAAFVDKFSRLAALRPTRPASSRPPTLREPDQEDAIARLIGAGVARNHFGEHLVLRNWFSTPEFSEPSAVALELLSRTRDAEISRRTRAALAGSVQVALSRHGDDRVSWRHGNLRVSHWAGLVGCRRASG